MAKSEQSWFSVVAASDSDPEILIYDYIGAYGVNARDFDKELKALGIPKTLTMRINSPGGETPQAASIYNTLSRWKDRTKAKVIVVIDGIALSAASWLAMLGDEVVMPENTLMMIHSPSGYASGTAKEMRAMSEVLDKVQQGMAAAYSRKSGKETDEVNEIMAKETWYTAQEAVDEGFADRVEGKVESVALSTINFDLTAYKNTPTILAGGVSSHNAADEQEEPTMVDTPKPETPAQMEARLRAEILASTQQSTTSTVVTAPAETPEQMEARIRAKMQEESNIRAYCAQVGADDKADQFIKDGLSMSDVFTALAPLLQQSAARPQGYVASTAASRLNSHVGGTQGQTEQLEVPKLDAVALWDKWNRRAA